MAQQDLDFGTASSNDGETLFAAFTKIQANFDELYAISGDADIAAIAALTGTGFSARTGTDTWALRTITGTANEVSVANGDGVSGNPTVSLPSALTMTGKTLTGGTYSAIAGLTSAGAVTPSASDVAALGSSGLMWSDLFLASGAVINFNAGNYTLTHSAGALTASGALSIAQGTIVDSAPLTLTQTWNDGADTFKAILANVTDTSSAAASLLMDLQVGGTSQFTVAKGGTVNAYGTSVQIGVTLDGQTTPVVAMGSDGSGVGSVRWAASAGAQDVFLYRDAAAALAQRNGTTAQTLRVYETFTDSSNYERAALSCSSDMVTLAAETAGTGADNIGITLTPAGTGTVTVSLNSLVIPAGGIELGHATDTTLARASAGVVSIEGVAILTHGIIDAKGDLIAGTASDTAARLAVGTNGQALTADSTQSTGLRWGLGGSDFLLHANGVI